MTSFGYKISWALTRAIITYVILLLIIPIVLRKSLDSLIIAIIIGIFLPPFIFIILDHKRNFHYGTYITRGIIALLIMLFCCGSFFLLGSNGIFVIFFAPLIASVITEFIGSPEPSRNESDL